jgi:hypothetical protein
MYGSTPTGVDRDKQQQQQQQSSTPSTPSPKLQPAQQPAVPNGLPVRRAGGPNGNGVGRRGGPTGPGGAAIKRSASIVPPPSAFNVAVPSGTANATANAAPYGSLPTGRDGMFFFLFFFFSFCFFVCFVCLINSVLLGAVFFFFFFFFSLTFSGCFCCHHWCSNSCSDATTTTTISHGCCWIWYNSNG